jgi:hypothetical protein
MQRAHAREAGIQRDQQSQRQVDLLLMRLTFLHSFACHRPAAVQPTCTGRSTAPEMPAPLKLTLPAEKFANVNRTPLQENFGS